MRYDSTSACLTRLVIDDDQELELSELQSVRQRIQSAVQYVVPRSHRAYVGDALLNLALDRLVSEQGPQHTATVLIHLADSALDNERADAAIATGARCSC
jgi:hypothetical protein